MIDVRFVGIDGQPQRFERTVRFADAAPQVEILELEPTLYPRWDRAFERDLHDLPADELIAIGRRIYALALGAGTEARLRELRGQGPVAIRIHERPGQLAVNRVPWELMHDGED